MLRARVAVVIMAVVLAACGGDDEPDAACADWQEIQGSEISDADAVERLNAIADDAESGNVREKALDLATLLESDATQTEVGAAYEALDAACEVEG